MAARGVAEPKTSRQAWDAGALLASPLFAPFHRAIRQLPADRFPTADDLNGIAGLPVRFVAPEQSKACGAIEYERRIVERGEVLTRPQNVHDLFNALVWSTYPRAKFALSRQHIQLADAAAGRGKPRDRLTLIDEGGVIVASSDTALDELLRDFRWEPLFVARRDEVRRRMHWHLFGHGLLEKALAPYKALTANAILVSVGDDFGRCSMAERNAIVDDSLAELFAGDPAHWMPTPVPILGVPGWCAENETPAFYDDPQVFRPGRRRTAATTR